MLFAISARGAFDSAKNFREMKDIIDRVIAKYGIGKIQYSFVVFGSTPAVRLTFTRPVNDEQLRGILQQTQRSVGASLKDTLKRAERIFDASPRPNAKRVLVLVMDKRSDNRLDDVKLSAESLWRSGVKVIPVAFGREAAQDEMEATTSEEDNLIDVRAASNPDQVAQEIMEKVLEGQ